MNDDSSGQNRFDVWENTVADAVAFAERFPREARSGIVQALLNHLAAPSATADPTPSTPDSGSNSSARGESGIAAVARTAQVNVNVLRRFIQLDEDGTVTVRARLGTSRADSQNVYGALLAYVRETALGELNTDGELIHTICNEHACMDRNLTANLRKRGWLLEHGVKGGSKSYRLSPAGEQAARERIVSLCAVESS